MSPATIITVVLAGAIAVGLFVLMLLRDVASDLAKQEIRAWLPLISRGIVRRTAEALPTDQQGVLEDMESQLNERSDRPITMLLFAMRVARDRRRIVAEAREFALESSGELRGTSSASVRVPLLGMFAAINRLITRVYFRIAHVSRIAHVPELTTRRLMRATEYLRPVTRVAAGILLGIGVLNNLSALWNQVSFLWFWLTSPAHLTLVAEIGGLLIALVLARPRRLLRAVVQRIFLRR